MLVLFLKSKKLNLFLDISSSLVFKNCPDCFGYWDLQNDIADHNRNFWYNAHSCLWP